MLRLVPDHCKIRKMCNHAVKKSSFVIRYFSDQCRTQQMCDRAILENGGTLDLFLIDIRPKKCVIKLLRIIFLC